MDFLKQHLDRFMAFFGMEFSILDAAQSDQHREAILYDLLLTIRYVLGSDESKLDDSIPLFCSYNEEDGICSKTDIEGWSRINQNASTSCTGQSGHYVFEDKVGRLALAQTIQELAITIGLL